MSPGAPIKPAKLIVLPLLGLSRTMTDRQSGRRSIFCSATDAARRACVVVSYSCEIARTFYRCVFRLGLRNAAHATSENRFTVSAGKSCATEVGARCTHLVIVVVWAKWALAGRPTHARARRPAVSRPPHTTWYTRARRRLGVARTRTREREPACGAWVPRWVRRSLCAVGTDHRDASAK